VGRNGTVPRVELGRHVRFMRAHVATAIFAAQRTPVAATAEIVGFMLQIEPADDTGVARFGIIAVAVLALASGGFGYVALGAAGVCDTSCPSDTAVVVYRVMYNAGFAVFVACVAFWNWRRNRRR
jgi:hypothetical protein